MSFLVMLTLSVLLMSMGSAEEGLEKEYLGCFVDSPRLFPIMHRSDNLVTPSTCAHSCFYDLNLFFSGVQWYKECWCSDSAPSESAVTNESDCDTPCNADPQVKCGGEYRMNIYEASEDVIPEPSQRYLGCYVDDPRIFPIKQRSDDAVTPFTCAQSCLNDLNMFYSGVQYYKECWCSDSAPPSAALTSYNECNTPCNADPTMKCGGTYRMSVYEMLEDSSPHEPTEEAF